MEDQLDAEAEAASPFHYDDDDKENHVTNPELVPRTDPLDGISIMPASHYRQHSGAYEPPSHSPMVSNAFYVQFLFEASPYGLGWSDGLPDSNSGYTRECPVPEYMRVLASSEDLPRSSSPREVSSEEIETVSSSPVRNTRHIELLR